MTAIHIRKATSEDMSGVHELVRQLATYEKAPHEVITTPEEYRNDYADGVFDCLVAVQGHEIVGIALYFLAYSTWKGRMYYLDDLVVREKMRGKGIGHQLFDALIEEARKNDIRRIKWQVLDWNAPAIHFYEKYKACFDKEWWNGSIEVG